MNDIRVKFIRGEEVKYISHLDLMKSFERTLRRSGVPISYSQGFNPHPNMVFGLPLSVGVTSEAEYVDFELVEKPDPFELSERINKELPAGLKIIRQEWKNTGSNIMAAIALASYEILVSSSEKSSIEKIRGAIGELMQRSAVVVEKEGKGGVREIDIKPMIVGLDARMLEEVESESCNNEECHDVCKNRCILDYVGKIKSNETKGLSYSTDNMFCLSAKLGAGSKANLKPDLLVSAINKERLMDLKLVKVHRTGLYIEKGGIFLDPLDQRALS